MSDKSAAQQIVEQDNAQIQALIDKLEQAQDARDKAGAVWEADTTLEHWRAVNEAAEACQEANRKLVQALRSLWKSGYRLTRSDK